MLRTIFAWISEYTLPNASRKERTKSRSLRTGLCMLGLALGLSSWDASACGIDYWRDSPLEMPMPTAMFDIECRVILGNDQPWSHAYEPGDSSRKKQERSVEVDLFEFATAVEGQPGADSLVAEYTLLRNSLHGHVSRWLAMIDGEMCYFGTFEQPAQPGQIRAVQRPAMFDLSPYESTLSRIPAEFREYIQGAVDYYAADWEGAARHFGAVLELPEKQRQYRSAWAAFMLGKTYLQFEPIKASEYFELTQKFAEEGFRDPLELALECDGWQARGEMLARQYVQAIHRYAAIAKGGSQSLRVVCRRALSADPIDAALVNDELSRDILTTWVLAHPQFANYPDRTLLADKWLTALEQYRPEGVVDFADRLAWFSYQRGAMDVAERWLKQCDPEAPYGRWVRAMLLLRAGDLEKGTTLLQELANEFPEDHLWRVQSRRHGMSVGSTAYARDEVRIDLAYARERRGDYIGALEAYCRAPDRDLAVHCAERTMTLDELKAYVDSPPETLSANRRNRFLPLQYVKNLLARRLAREGRWGDAINYFSEEPALRKLAEDVRNHLENAEDGARPPAERGRSQYEIGRIIREHGPDLLSPELVPDLEYRHGSETGPNRERDSQKCYPKMNYYRYMASDYMWRAAELLPDNDPLTAEALYLGGTYIMKKDPQAADRFYKALVRRNPNLLIAQQANQRRWFPKNFTDVAVYQPRPEPHWYDRKRNIALAVLPFAVLLLLLSWPIVKRFRRRAKPSGEHEA